MKTAVTFLIIIVLIPLYSCNKQSSETKEAQSNTIEIAIHENSQLLIDVKTNSMRKRCVNYYYCVFA